MRSEWAEAGWGSRSLFVIAAIYWAAVAVLLLLSLPLARNANEIALVIGFYVVPLAYALAFRGIYVAFSRRRPRPRLWSWWLLVLGALLGILITVARVTIPSS